MHGMVYFESDGAWLLPGPDGRRCEVLVAGSRDAPDPERLALMQRVLPRLDELHERPASFLDAFVDRARIAPGVHAWDLDGVASAPRAAPARTRCSCRATCPTTKPAARWPTRRCSAGGASTRWSTTPASPPSPAATGTRSMPRRSSASSASMHSAPSR